MQGLLLDETAKFGMLKLKIPFLFPGSCQSDPENEVVKIHGNMALE